VRAGDTVFVIQHVPPKDLPAGCPTSALVFQALRYLGRDAVDQEIISRLRSALSAEDRRRLLHDARCTTGWIAEVAREVAAGNVEQAAEEVDRG
jgi:hypothetical protein